MFKLHSNFEPTGDQPEAIAKLVDGIKKGDRAQTLLRCNAVLVRRLLWQILSSECKNQRLFWHITKRLLGQLYSEFKEFFPENAVEYFVS